MIPIPPSWINAKIIENENKLGKIATLEKEISYLKEHNKTEINKKKFGVEVGYDTSRSYYIHCSYDISNSFFMGTHGQIGNNNTLGVGLGIRL